MGEGVEMGWRWGWIILMMMMMMMRGFMFNYLRIERGINSGVHVFAG